jgi:hypothetical protein
VKIAPADAAGTATDSMLDDTVMPYLYCEKHGQEHLARTVEHQDELRQEGESVLAVTGTLITGIWLCDRCNAELDKGDRAVWVYAFPSHCRPDLYDYDFGYELEYFAMTKSDTATVYGADWPDDSIRNRRITRRRQVRQPKTPVCALDLFGKK